MNLLLINKIPSPLIHIIGSYTLPLQKDIRHNKIQCLLEFIRQTRPLRDILNFQGKYEKIFRSNY